MQRTREEIAKDWEAGQPSITPNSFILELLSDMRDQNTEIISLLQKLVDRKGKKIISAEVELSPKEQELINGLDEIQA